LFTVLCAFGPSDPSTAIVYVAAVASFALAAFAPSFSSNFPGGQLGLIALGLGLWLFPMMWNTVDVAL
jgi:hypothetical protein